MLRQAYQKNNKALKWGLSGALLLLALYFILFASNALGPFGDDLAGTISLGICMPLMGGLCFGLGKKLWMHYTEQQVSGLQENLLANKPEDPILIAVNEIVEETNPSLLTRPDFDIEKHAAQCHALTVHCTRTRMQEANVSYSGCSILLYFCCPCLRPGYRNLKLFLDFAKYLESEWALNRQGQPISYLRDLKLHGYPYEDLPAIFMKNEHIATQQILGKTETELQISSNRERRKQRMTGNWEDDFESMITPTIPASPVKLNGV